MSDEKNQGHITKSHNKTLLMYHIVFPAKYRKKIITQEIDQTLKNTCLELADRYEIFFIEIGSDIDHIHFLIQSIPAMSVAKIVQIIKGNTSREIFKKHKEVKKQLWGGNLWTSGFYANTVGLYGNKDIIQNYVKNQGKTYNQIYQNQNQLPLFPEL